LIKVVLLDIDDTLLDFQGYVKESLQEGFREFNLGEYHEGVYATFTRINTALWHEIEEGKLTIPDLRRVRWNRIFGELGVTYDGAAFEDYFRGRLFHSAIRVEGAMELLEYLYGRYILAVASNGPYAQQVNRLKNGGMLDCFTGIFVSEKIGVSKPAPAFFDACMAELNEGRVDPILPGEVLMVGDSVSSDMKGAIGYGMKTCYFNRFGKGLPEGMTVDYEITHLEHLIGLI